VTTTNGELVSQIRKAIDEAHQQGRHRPGRPALVELTGASDYDVRKVLEELANEQRRQPPGQPGLMDLAGAADHQVRHGWTDLADEEASDGQLPDGLGNQRDGSQLDFSGLGNESTNAGEDIANAGRQPDEPHPDTARDGLHLDARPTAPEVATTDPGEDASAGPSTVTNAGVTHPRHGAPGGRLVAWTGFVFGSITSIAANVLHAWLPAAHEPPGWSPGLPPQIGAAVWPLGLMLAVEALSRIHWPSGFGWGLARYGGAGAVALGSAVISYGHLRDVLLAWQYGPLSAAVGPLVLDGLMVVCGFALLANSLASAGEAARGDG
jgi:Protein of unknown function (DUF2637)